MADDSNVTRADANKAFEQFQELTRKLLAVPKKEADAEEAAYRRKKARKARKKRKQA